MSVSARLEQLGIKIPDVVPPVAAYVPAKRHGDVIYTAGQLPMASGQLMGTGKVGDQVSAEDAYRYARQCAVNAIAAAAAIAGGVDSLASVVRVTGFVASVPDFIGQPAVINGASDVLGEIFGEPHARSAVGVSVLPLDSPVEVEVIFALA